MNEVAFPREIDSILASANEHGLFVIAGWTIGIPKTTAIKYVKTFNSSPDTGFYQYDGTVILSHGSAKLTLTNKEAQAVIELIKTVYGPF